jgi:hypothetical protein
MSRKEQNTRGVQKQEKKDYLKSRARVGTSGRREHIRKGCRRVNMVEYYALMNENGEMRPVEAVPVMGSGRIRENDGVVNSSMIYCKTLANVKMDPRTTMKTKILNTKKSLATGSSGRA